ncbi:MAG: ATP-binding cassette domain-containing protein [Epsilonproteobacteria bacterium]|nr:ABC transporter permease [Campylobacterota bacterium]NPA57649.1 ATP-binding cassette domain-containing protein [Campylobacterota bacterium]
MVAAAVGTSASAYLVKPILDEIFINRDAEMLTLLPPMVIFIYLLKGVGRYVQVYYTEYIGHHIITRLREQMLHSILAMPYSYFVSQPSGELISRLTNDINRVKSVVANLIPDLLRESLTIVALLFVVIYQSPLLSLYFLFIMPLSLYPLSRLAKQMKKASHRSQEKISDLTTHLSEIFNNIELIKAEAKEDDELDRFSRHNREFFTLTMKQIRINNFVSPFMEVLGAIVVALVIYVGGSQVLEGNMTTGEFFSFMTALFMLYSPIKRVASIHNKIQDALAAAERIFGIIELRSPVTSGDRLLQDPKRICFEGVSLRYGSKEALRNIDLCLQRDRITAVVGRSGSGKSSLIALLLRFFEPSGGRITIDGIDIREFDLKSLRSQIALVTQRTYLFQATIAQNVAGSLEYDRERVIEALKRAEAWEFVSQLPEGIDTEIMEAGANLSGGQRQRLAIARAIYKDAHILIFDEATSALDRKSEAAILNTIRSLAKGRILLLISHNLPGITFADEIILLQKGRIVARGSHQELLESSSLYREFFERV